jgi:hypothetical protein
MKNSTRNILHYIIFIIGLVLMIGGIITGKHGATVVGLIVAAVNVQQIIVLKKKS